MSRMIAFIFLTVSPFAFGQVPFVPPMPDGNKPPQNTPPPAVNNQLTYQSKDPVLGERIAKISAALEKIPQDQQQLWREYDITPYTTRTFPAGSPKPETVISDWILRQTGTMLWHTAPFGILSSDANKLYCYQTKEVQLAVADIVDRFVCTELFTGTFSLRVIALTKPMLNGGKPAPLTTPIRIASSGVQGWLVDPVQIQTLIQDLNKRFDFREIVPLQTPLPNGVPYRFTAKRQRPYLRGVQASATGYIEDKAVIDEGVALSFVPLLLLDGQSAAAAVKLDILQVERMHSSFIQAGTQSAPFNKVTVETPQLAEYKLDELIQFPKDKVLLLDLGMVPLPDTAGENAGGNIITDITKHITAAKRSNIIVIIGR